MQIKGMRYDLPAGETMLPRFSGKDSLIREPTRRLHIVKMPDYEPSHGLPRWRRHDLYAMGTVIFYACCSTTVS